MPTTMLLRVCCVCACCVVLVAADGVVTDGPGPYRNNQFVVYNATCAMNQAILFELTEMSIECFYDSFAIQDASMTQIYNSDDDCGRTLSQHTIPCTTATATITFSSDYINTDLGYHVTWRCVPPESLPSYTPTKTATPSHTFSNTISPSPSSTLQTVAQPTSGYITHGQGLYKNQNDLVFNLQCRDPSHGIMFVLLEMDIECNFDELVILTGANELIYSSNTNCENQMRVTNHPCLTPIASVVFHSDYIITGSGFNISWECVARERLPSPSRSTSTTKSQSASLSMTASPSATPSTTPSPQTRGLYSVAHFDSAVSKHTTHLVSCPLEQRPLFTVSELQLEAVLSELLILDSNNTKIFDSNVACGEVQLSHRSWLSRTNCATVQLNSDPVTKPLNFNVSWVCVAKDLLVNNQTHAPNSALSRPDALIGFVTDGPGFYNNHVNQVHRVTCGSSFGIRFTLLRLDLECPSDILTIRNADNTILFDSSRDCDSVHGLNITCTTPSATLRFSTDDMDVDNGFVVRWECVKSIEKNINYVCVLAVGLACLVGCFCGFAASKAKKESHHRLLTVKTFHQTASEC